MRTRSTPLDLAETRAVRSLVSGLPKWCGFLGIARELRNMIYIDLITSGNVTILRVSRQVHNEAKELLYKDGICRLELYPQFSSIDSKILRNAVKLPPNTTAYNLNVTMYLQSPLPDSRFKSARVEEVGPGFKHFIQGSGDCHITLFLPGPFGITIPPELFDLIRSLNTFKLITVTIHVPHIYHPMDRRIKRLVEPCYPETLNRIATSCSDAFGDPEWKTNTTTIYPKYRNPYVKDRLDITLFPSTPYLEFHPHKA